MNANQGRTRAALCTNCLLPSTDYIRSRASGDSQSSVLYPCPACKEIKTPLSAAGRNNKEVFRCPFIPPPQWRGGQYARLVAVGEVALPFNIAQPSQPRFRYWVDEAALWVNSKGSGHVLEHVLNSSGGLRTGGPPHPGRGVLVHPDDLGCNHTDKWDLLWSSRKVCMLAAARLTTGQVVSTVPGLYMLTLKKQLVSTMRQAYGMEGCNMLTPASFLLPEELPAWRQALQQQHASGGNDSMWMLKSHAGMGQGLHLVAGQHAADVAVSLNRDNLKPFVVAQRYVERPLLLAGGRKSHLRLWVLVTGVVPLRAYIHRRGLVLFSAERYNPAAAGGAAAAGMHAGHITNRHANAGGTVWELGRLAAHLGAAAHGALWQALVQSTACTVAAGLRHMVSARRSLSLPQGAEFQLLGFDYLVDEGMKPWLLEVNANPSLAATHDDPEARQVLLTEKWRMLTDTIRLLLLRLPAHRPDASPPLSRESSHVAAEHEAKPFLEQGLQLALRELDARGEFLPLMPHFPMECNSIPWQDADRQLMSHMARTP